MKKLLISFSYLFLFTLHSFSTPLPADSLRCYKKELGDFSFLEGKWKVTSNYLQSNNKFDTTFGKSTIKWNPDQCSFVEEFLTTRGDHEYKAKGIYTFYSVKGMFQKLWIDSEHGALLVYEGVKQDNGNLVLDVNIRVDSKNINSVIRHTYFPPGKNSFSFSVTRSVDGGATFSEVYKAHYERTN